MDVREKLVELFFDAQQMVFVPYGMETEKAARYIFEQMADHLIANGVTVQELDGCEYCKVEFIGENPIVTLGNDCGINSVVEDEFLYNFCNCGTKSIAKINFCPMCGRRLPQPPKGE